ncbi:unnamed protein product [Peniophora sp. CBMAI 1063]|nr:unnamed protein product [Peniophora sp. CBMAI 1063]
MYMSHKPGWLFPTNGTRQDFSGWGVLHLDFDFRGSSCPAPTSILIKKEQSEENITNLIPAQGDPEPAYNGSGLLEDGMLPHDLAGQVVSGDNFRPLEPANDHGQAVPAEHAAESADEAISFAIFSAPEAGDESSACDTSSTEADSRTSVAHDGDSLADIIYGDLTPSLAQHLDLIRDYASRVGAARAPDSVAFYSLLVRTHLGDNGRAHVMPGVMHDALIVSSGVDVDEQFYEAWVRMCPGCPSQAS